MGLFGQGSSIFGGFMILQCGIILMPTQGIRWNDCGNSKSIVTISKLDLQPNPLILPGPISVWLVVNISKPLPRKAYADVMIAKEAFSFSLPLPCPHHSDKGKCKFEICTSMEKYFKPLCQSYPGFEKFPCSCPVNVGSHSINNLTVSLPFDVSDYKGSYDIKIKIWDEDTEIGCMKFPFVL
ncbi:unnamed protein product [Gordionus sp. m RMFG-2023]|uniref:ganglioside GM2 activator-like n=1 Tax=Gordionus sp. m RMFG-2023 TaxID=3053472 RepID=UPI0030E015A2